MIKRPSHSWVHRHHLALASIGIVLVACATFLLLATVTAQREIRDSETQLAITRKFYSDTLPKLKAKHDADMAAAAKTAEAAKTVTDPAAAASLPCINLLQHHADPAKIDILVNKVHCLSPLNYAPSDLTSVDGYMVSAKVASHLSDMLASAASANATLSLTSAYRSYDDQVAIYRDLVTNKGAAAADAMSARPGYSEHQTGLAVDFGAGDCFLECFATTNQYSWLQAHAADYGFIQRYYPETTRHTGYEAEPWHYRYVGKEIALAMKAKGVKSLEQYWGISGGDYLR